MSQSRNKQTPAELKCHKKESGRSFTHQYGRMKWDETAPTITTQFFNYGAGRFGHPEYLEDNHPENVNRALSLREGALLQTFPDNYKFVENHEEFGLEPIGQWIGNAVPPILAETIGESIVDHIEAARREGQLVDVSKTTAAESEFLASVRQSGD